MDFTAIIRIAIRGLARNKLRSGLTMLGIVIGVAAVIAMVNIGKGARDATQQQIAAMGSNLLVVNSGSVNKGGTRTGANATKTLVNDDVTAIVHDVPGVTAAAPVNATSTQIVFENNNWSTRVTGTEPQYFDVRSWAFASGADFQQSDVESAANVAVIGDTASKNLFTDGSDPVGKTIRISNLPFKIVGLLQRKGTSGMGDDQDDAIFIPITTLQKKLTGEDWLRSIMVSANSRDNSYAVQDEITALLRDRHRIRKGQDDDFNVRNLADMAALADQQASLMTMLLASIASVSLVVGGIGIMNIMLVSVTERTREIGVRKAIGARKYDIIKQFLIEAVLLSELGGLAGILTGVLGGNGIAVAFDMNMVFPWFWAITGLVVCSAIGIGFGSYPAWKAASLHPIEALRYE